MENKQKIGRFAIVGIVNTLIDFGLLFTFTNFGVTKIIANTISTGTAFIFSFFANKKFTFKTHSKNIQREIFLFVIVTLFGLWVLQNGVIWLLTPLLQRFFTHQSIVLFVAKLFATGVSLVWNFIMYDRVVFIEHHTKNSEKNHEPHRD